MRVRKTSPDGTGDKPLDGLESSFSPAIAAADADPEIPQALDFVDFSSGKLMTSLGCLVWLVIVAANVYVLVSLGMGG